MNLSVFTQTDGSVVATVQIKCLSQAQTAIANLQRYRLGNQRIKISFHNTTPEQRQLTRYFLISEKTYSIFNYCKGDK